MAIKHDFRVIIDTVKKRQYSYKSSSIFNSDVDTNYAVSASDMWHRITGSVSCSYVNDFSWSGTELASKTFADDAFLSSSLNGSLDTGSISFKYSGLQPFGIDKQDRLKRFKFFGSGFCTATNLVENFWYRPDEFKFGSGSEANYFRGDVDANSLTVLNNFNVASVGSVTTHLPFKIDKTDSKFIKFVNISGSNDLPNNDVFFGYNQLTNNYELSASFKDGETSKFNIGGVNELQANSLNITHLTSSYQTSSVQQIFTEITSSGNSVFGDADSDIHTFNGDITGSGGIRVVGDNGVQIYSPQTFALNMERGGITFGSTNTGLMYWDPQIPNYVNIIKSTVNSRYIHVGASSQGLKLFGGTTSVIISSSLNDYESPGFVTVSGSISASGDIKGNRLYAQGSTSPMVNLERTDGGAVNAVIGFTNGNGSMYAGIDGDIQNSGANIFGIGYYGDLIDNNGTDHATFVVTGSQVVINNATSASKGVALTVGGELHTTSHITSSGNIIASATEPRIRVEAATDNKPGYEWLEAGSRKWIIFNDPDSSQGGNDNLTWKNASGTELMELDQDGILYVSSKIAHLDDTDTFINFTTDDINFKAGNQNMIDLTSGSQSEITFNEDGIDIDFRVEGDSDTNLLFTNAGTDKVGIGTNAPTHKLTVEGDISASGDLYLGTAGVTTDKGLTITSKEDTFIKLIADVGNSGEDDNPYIQLVQDIAGGPTNVGVSGSIGLVGNANKDPQNNTYTGTKTNALFIGTYFAATADTEDSPIMFGTSGSDGLNARMTVDSGRDGTYVGIGNMSPTETLTVEGDISASAGISVGNVGTKKGNFSVNYGLGGTMTGSLSNPGDGYGDIVSHTTVHSSVRTGDIVYLRGNTGDWRQADADAEATAGAPLIGVKLAPINQVLLRGFVKLNPITGSSNTLGGQPVYVSELPGSASWHAPSGTGDIVRIIGHTYSTSSHETIYFNPDTSYVELS